MPSKKKKYNARFPAGRIKKIMQTDEEIGKVAQAVPVIISRTLELFVESLLKRAMHITSAKNAKTLTPTHMKQCILSESRFDFLKDLVKGIPDVSSTDDEFGTPSGNLSPGTPLSAKAYGGYTCFQFHQSTDSSSSKSSGATSQQFIPQPSQPKFYKEIPIGSEDCENRSGENSSPSVITGTTVIQHTGSRFSNHCPPLAPSTHPLGNPPREGNPSALLRTISGRNIAQLNELKLSNCIKTSDSAKRGEATSAPASIREEQEEEEGCPGAGEGEEDQEEPQPEENGFHKEAKIPKTCVIDEDYDT